MIVVGGAGGDEKFGSGVGRGGGRRGSTNISRAYPLLEFYCHIILFL